MGNNMLAFLEDKMRQEGRVRASTRWYPACSLLDDTVKALHELARAAPGLYMLDSNERWTFYEIARALSARHGGRWQVEPSEDFVFDQRMRDERIQLPSLKERLPGLP
jgi:dTDP-4-dehydrorhamnose reductase